MTLDAPIANLELVYVSDVERSTQFYKILFNYEPIFSSPRYITFSATDDRKSLSSIYLGGKRPDPNTPRFTEMGILLPSNEEMDDCDYNSSSEKGVTGKRRAILS